MIEGFSVEYLGGNKRRNMKREYNYSGIKDLYRLETPLIYVTLGAMLSVIIHPTPGLV